MSRTCVVMPTGWTYRDALKKVLTELGLWPDPREDWHEARLNHEQVEKLIHHFERVFIPHDLEKLAEPFLVIHLRADSETRDILRKVVDGKLFPATNGTGSPLHGCDFFFYADEEGEEEILAETFRPLLIAA